MHLKLKMKRWTLWGWCDICHRPSGWQTGPWGYATALKGALKGSQTYQLIWKLYTSRTGCYHSFSLSDPVRGDFCVLSSSWTASASHWVLPCFSSAISCDTIGWQGSHPVSKLPLGSVSNSSAPDKSSLHKLHKNVYIKQENGEIMCSNWL